MSRFSVTAMPYRFPSSGKIRHKFEIIPTANLFTKLDRNSNIRKSFTFVGVSSFPTLDGVDLALTRKTLTDVEKIALPGVLICSCQILAEINFCIQKINSDIKILFNKLRYLLR